MPGILDRPAFELPELQINFCSQAFFLHRPPYPAMTEIFLSPQKHTGGWRLMILLSSTPMLK